MIIVTSTQEASVHVSNLTDRSLGSHQHWSGLCAAVVQEPESLHVWKVSDERLSTRCSPGIRFLRPPMPAPAVTILKRMSCLFLSRCSCCSCWIRFQPSLPSRQSPVGFQCVTYHHSLLCWVRGHCYITCSFTFPQMVTWRAGDNQQKLWPQPRPRKVHSGDKLQKRHLKCWQFEINCNGCNQSKSNWMVIWMCLVYGVSKEACKRDLNFLANFQEQQRQTILLLHAI